MSNNTSIQLEPASAERANSITALRNKLTRLLQLSGNEAVLKDTAAIPDDDAEVGEYLSFADLDDGPEVLAANKEVSSIRFPAESVRLVEKGFAKGSNPVKIIVTRGLTLNEIAAMSGGTTDKGN